MRKNQITDTLEKSLIWLSASDPEVLKNVCPRWEKIKYEAFGASVLVPVFFGMIASAYAISTLTSNWFFIGMFALIWGFIILTIDRVLLSTYRAFVSASKKWIQFVLRISVAVLMGLTVSHPLTLLLFKDTINSEIEKQRTKEMLAMRQTTDGDKKALEDRIRVVSEELASHQRRYQETVNGDFLHTPAKPVVRQKSNVTDPQFADIDAQIREYKIEREEVRRDLERWQATYDEEVRGVRSGKSGVGPNARAIERDHISWRRDEIRRLNGVIGDLTGRRSKLSSELMARNMEVHASLESNRRALEKQKMEVFASQQGQLLEVIKGQIDSTSAELAMLRKDAGQISTDTSDRVAYLKVEKRSDLMAQTHTLHQMFKNPEAGGGFALAVYIVLVALFTMIDTIPLVVKFCSVPGLYDKHLYYKENSVRAIGLNESIDEQFSCEMKKRDDILHELLHYNPMSDTEKQALAAAAPQLPAAAVEEVEEVITEEVVDDSEIIVAMDDSQIEAIESVEIIAPGEDPKPNGVQREIHGQINTVVAKNETARPLTAQGTLPNVGLNAIEVEPAQEEVARIEALRMVEEQNAAAEEAALIAEAERAEEAQRVMVAEQQKAAAEAERVAEAQKAARIAEAQKAAETQRLAELRSQAAQAPVAAQAPKQEEVAASFQDETQMTQAGFGAVLLNKETSEGAVTAEIEVPINEPTKAAPGRPTYSQSNFRNNWAAQKAAGGIALQPNNLSEKAR